MKDQLNEVAVPELNAAMVHLLGRGKLFRPVLALAVYHALTGKDPEPYVPLVTPLEIIHTFTLIHDDLPSMDDAELRRGVAAVHIEFSEAMAVLAGDALLNLAFKLLAEAEHPDVDCVARVALTRAVSRATHAVVEGQVLDIQGEERELNLEEIQRMHRLKTGALLGACCEVGAVLAKGSQLQAGLLREVGMLLGLAFQIRDDMLSVESTDAVMGKTLSTDIDKKKSTYARLLGPEGSEDQLQQTLRQVEDKIADLDLTDAGPLEEIARWVVKRRH